MLCFGILFPLSLIISIQAQSSDYVIPCKNPPESGRYCAFGEYCGQYSPNSCIPLGAIECGNGYYCPRGNYYSAAPGKCIPFGKIDCPHLNGSCAIGESCGRSNCIPAGAMECANGRYCDLGHYCSKKRPGTCIPIGETECETTSCGPGFHCGKFSPHECIPNGHTECQIRKGRYCAPGSFCDERGSCISFGHIDCPNLNKSCAAGESCGRINCIPAGTMELLNGGYCSQGMFPGKFHTEKCVTIGTIECEHFSHKSCGNGFYCGKRDCVPVGHVECSDGSTCGPDHYCSNSSSPVKCIPRGSVECAGANAKGHCEAGEQCVRGVCVPKGRQLCADNKHHCDRQHQVCDMSFSLVNPTNYTRGCLPKDVSICDGYKELDQKVPCGEDGYLLKHGYRYCRKFFAYFYTLSEEEQKVLKCIIRCLLRKFRRFVSNDGSMQISCAQIAQMAARHYHMSCYRKPECKLCSIRSHNYHPIWGIIESELTPEEDRQMVAQMCTAGHHVAQNIPPDADDSDDEDEVEEE